MEQGLIAMRRTGVVICTFLVIITEDEGSGEKEI